MVNSNSVNADLLIKINALLCVELLTCTVSENHLVTYCINPIFVDSENNVIVTRKNYLYFNKLSQYCDERRISVTVPIDLCYNRFDTLVLSIRLFDSVPINNTSLLILANFLADFNPQMLIQS